MNSRTMKRIKEGPPRLPLMMAPAMNGGAFNARQKLGTPTCHKRYSSSGDVSPSSSQVRKSAPRPTTTPKIKCLFMPLLPEVGSFEKRALPKDASCYFLYASVQSPSKKSLGIGISPL